MIVIGIHRDAALRSLELDAAGRRNDFFRIVGAGAFGCGREEIDLTVGALRIEAAERCLAETGRETPRESVGWLGSRRCRNRSRR